MKRTQHITLGLLAGMALAFTSGCNRQAERRDCVDYVWAHYERPKLPVGGGTAAYSGYGGSVSILSLLYGGSSGGHMGDVVVNGNPTPGIGR